MPDARRRAWRARLGQRDALPGEHGSAGLWSDWGRSMRDRRGPSERARLPPSLGRASAGSWQGRSRQACARGVPARDPRTRVAWQLRLHWISGWVSHRARGAGSGPSKPCAAAHAMFLPILGRAIARTPRIAQPDRRSVHPVQGGAGRQRKRPQVRAEKFGCLRSSAFRRSSGVASFGDPAPEGVGVDLSEFVAEGDEHLPFGIEGADPSGQFLAVGDVDGPDDPLDQRNLARDE